MTTMREEREERLSQSVHLADVEKRLELTSTLERDSRALVQAAYAELIQQHVERQNVAAQVKQVEAAAAAKIAELEAVAAQLRIEIDRRDARIKELKAWRDRTQNSIPGRVLRAARRLTS